jgi:hypothetical protein
LINHIPRIAGIVMSHHHLLYSFMMKKIQPRLASSSCQHILGSLYLESIYGNVGWLFSKGERNWTGYRSTLL